MAREPRRTFDAVAVAASPLVIAPPRAREVGNLQGAPIREKFPRYAPVDDVAGAKELRDAVHRRGARGAVLESGAPPRRPINARLDPSATW
jgi:hypothetical protein